MRIVLAITILFQIFTDLVVFAQGVGGIKGKVMDGDTGAPLPFAHVYINNTSLGVTADSTGNYWLKNVPIQYSDLVFSYVGYDTRMVKVSLREGLALDVQARLRPSKGMLSEMVVRATRDTKWKKNYERFKKVFFGTGSNASFCEIANAGVLNFREELNIKLYASASQPLEIYNRALGYKISLDLSSFELSQTNYNILYNAFFSALQPKDDREKNRWMLNREKSYKGSERHFLKSLIEGRANEEGFRIYPAEEGVTQRAASHYERPPSVPFTPLYSKFKPAKGELHPTVMPDETRQGYFKFFEKGTFEIDYLNKFEAVDERWFNDFPHPVSWITVRKEFLQCAFDGIVRSNTSRFVSGAMSGQRVADILPDDYDPVKSEALRYLSWKTQLGSLWGTVTDSVTHRPLRGSRVFLNNSLFQAITDSTGGFELKNIPLGIYDMVITGSPFGLITNKVTITAGATRADILVGEQKNSLEGSGKHFSKRSFFRKYLGIGFLSKVIILNTGDVEVRFSNDRKRGWIKTSVPLEIDDSRMGYRVHYYINDSEVDFRNPKKSRINGYFCFDTLPARTARKRQECVDNRDKYYQGSLNQFLYSLVQGRAAEERFQISVSSPLTGVEKNQNKGNRSEQLIPGDSLLTAEDGGRNFKIKFPPKTEVRFARGRPTTIVADSGLQVSSAGILSSAGLLKLRGPMERKKLPVIPIEYVSVYQGITDPKVRVLVGENDWALWQRREKVFVHTDKSYYYPGEKIWYKAYLHYYSHAFRDSLSRVLHVELISSEKKIVKRAVLKIQEGRAWGDFALPDSLKSGNYFLRAYTRWSLNFGQEDIFLQLIPVLPTNQKYEHIDPIIKSMSGRELLVSIQHDVQAPYKVRDKISLTVKVNDLAGGAVNSNLSVSVTDANEVEQPSWSRSILEDTAFRKKVSSGYTRVSHRMEKENTFDGVVERESGNRNAATVLVASMRENQASILKPDREGRFKFNADFYDTASFLFRANLTNGTFAGHVKIQLPFSAPISIPAMLPVNKLINRQDDMKDRVAYAYDPGDSTKFLEEVVVRGTRMIGSSQTNVLIEGEKLKQFNQFDTNTAMSIISGKLGAQGRYVFDKDCQCGYFLIRNEPASTLVNGRPGDPSTINPQEIVRVAVYKSALGNVISFEVKYGLNIGNGKSQFDRCMLTGYSLSSKFYMPNHSSGNLKAEPPDLRTTIYWQPNVTVGKDGATLSFYAADMPARYRIVVQGLSEDGKPLYGEAEIEVRK